MTLGSGCALDIEDDAICAEVRALREEVKTVRQQLPPPVIIHP